MAPLEDGGRTIRAQRLLGCGGGKNRQLAVEVADVKAKEARYETLG